MVDSSSEEIDTNALAVISKPLAQGKLYKHVLKTVKKSAKDKSLKRGVKEVVKCIRKSGTGYKIRI
jgi:H/ACA ribonucleoprotein complex subunit 2